MVNYLKKNLYWFLLGFVVFLGFILRLKGLISNPSLWHDECALAWNILEKSYTELFGKLRFLQVAPPMFLVCSKFLVSIFHVKNNVFLCDFVLRLIPFVFGTLSIIVFYFVCKSVFKSRWTILIAVVLFSLNPVLINYSFEFKPYILDVFSALVCLWIFLNIDFAKMTSKTILIWGSILAILPWFSFMSVMVIFGGFMALSFKKENPKNFFLLFLSVILSGFAYLKLFVLNSYAQNSGGMVNFWQNEFVSKDLSNLTQLNMNNLKYFFSGLPMFSCTILTILMFVGLILAFKDKNWRLILITALTESALIIASILNVYPYSQRLIIFLIPFILIFAVKIFDINNKILAGILISLIIIPHLMFAINFIKISNLNKGDFAREIMLQMSNRIKMSEIIVINKSSIPEFCYYDLFVNLKNDKIFLRPKEKTAQALRNELDTRIKKGNYWVYMPYDYSSGKSEINEIEKWVRTNTNIEFVLKSTQSTLIKTNLN